jgi:hypothetical protein
VKFFSKEEALTNEEVMTKALIAEIAPFIKKNMGSMIALVRKYRRRKFLVNQYQD